MECPWNESCQLEIIFMMKNLNENQERVVSSFSQIFTPGF